MLLVDVEGVRIFLAVNQQLTGDGGSLVHRRLSLWMTCYLLLRPQLFN